MKKRVLGTSKITTDNKVTLIEPVVEKLKSKLGDNLVFYEENDRVFIEVA